MRPAWRLAISSLWADGRPRARPLLLVATVALSAAMIAAVACAMGSANAAVRAQLESQLGRADLTVAPATRGAPLPPGVLGVVRSWPEVRSATPVIEQAVSLAFETQTMQPDGAGAFVRRPRTLSGAAVARGEPAEALRASVPRLVAGRLPEAPGEVVLDALLAERLTPGFADEFAGSMVGAAAARGDVSYLELPASLPVRAGAGEAGALNRRVGPRPGDRLRALRFLRPPVELTVVGVTEPPPLGGRPTLYASGETLALLSGRGEALTGIEVALADPTRAEAVAERRRAELMEAFDRRVTLRTSAKIAAGVEQNLASSRLGFYLTATMAFMSAAFIITTGMNTALGEQQRSLATLRCIGGTRAQLAQTQFFYGLVIGALGAAIGVPLGVGIAWAVVQVFRADVPTGLSTPPALLAFAGVGAVVCGLGGAAFPAWRAARTSPLRALTQRAHPARGRGLVLTGLIGAGLVAAQLVLANASDDGQFIFWSYALFGVEAMFVGWFLLCVPATLGVSRLLSPALSRALGLPRRLLRRTIAASPYGHGFTAGALMAGLALMIAIWTNGGAFLRDWLGKLQFPDAFVQGLALTPEARERLEEMPFVRGTSAITIHPITPVREAGFGVRAIQRYATNFVAFEPGPFLAMTDLEWLEGDPASAVPRLEAGGAILVAREFQAANGLGVGDVFRATDPMGDPERVFEFEIVGVVTSPGLEIVSKFFTLGETYTDQSLHAVFGTRADLREKFGSEAIQLIQIDLADPGSPGYAPDEEAIETIKAELAGTGILEAGSGRLIKERLIEFVGGMLLVFTGVAVIGMLIACLGVANLIIASVDARRFELGVLRAVGAQRSLLTRLVLAEACVIAITAVVIGTLMGTQAAWTGRVLYRALIGISMAFALPTRAVLGGWATVVVLTLAAAAPAVWRMNRRSVRELLA